MTAFHYNMAVINPTPGPLGRRFLGRKMHFSRKNSRNDAKMPQAQRARRRNGGGRGRRRWRVGKQCKSGKAGMRRRRPDARPREPGRSSFNGPRENSSKRGRRHRRRKRFESSRQQNTSVTRDTCRLTRICIPIPPRIPPPAPSRRLAGAATARYSDPAAQAPLPSSGRGGCYELLRALHLS